MAGGDFIRPVDCIRFPQDQWNQESFYGLGGVERGDWLVSRNAPLRGTIQEGPFP